MKDRIVVPKWAADSWIRKGWKPTGVAIDSVYDEELVQLEKEDV